MLGVAVSAASCGLQPYFIAKHEPWRRTAELNCLRSGMVREASYLIGRPQLKGPQTCGAIRPFQVWGLDGGRVRLRPAATLRCPMVPQLERWVRSVVQPEALSQFGQPVVEMKVLASYSCRPRNNVRGARLSEHGHANAIDLAQFTLRDGRVISVKHHWRGAGANGRFLRNIHHAACRIFTTVLGPNHDANHRDHFHFDLARHQTRLGRKSGLSYCR